MWLFTFTSNYNLVKVYIGVWLILGSFGGAFMFISTTAYLLVAIGKYATDSAVSVGEIWLTLILYLLIQVPDIYLTRRFAWASILYLIGGNVQIWCESHQGTCLGWHLLELEPVPETFEEIDEFDF